MANPIELAQTARLTEYNSIRSSIDLRIRLRNQVTALTITLFGVFAGLAVHKDVPPIVPLIFPILSLLLAIEWAHLDHRIAVMGQFIRLEIENTVDGLAWYSYLRQSRRGRRTRWNAIAANGVFVGTSVLSMLVSTFGWSSLFGMYGASLYVALFIDISAIVATCLVLRWTHWKDLDSRSDEAE